jgi:hypothetical protein
MPNRDEEPAYSRRKRDAEEQRYRRELDRKTYALNRRSVWALAGTIVVAAFAICVSECSSEREIAANRTSSNAQIAANKASSDQQISALKDQTLYAERAWVDAQNIRIGGPLTYDVNGANFMLAFWLKNVGHAPATSVMATPFVTTTLLPDYSTKNWSGPQYLKQLMGERCPMPIGDALLPEGVHDGIYKFTINNDQLKVLRAKFGTNTVILNPRVLLVIQYCTGFDDLIHTTIYALQINRKLSGARKKAELQKNRSDQAFFVDEGSVPTEDMEVRLTAIGGSSAN